MSKFDSSYDRSQALTLAKRLAKTAEDGPLPTPLPLPQSESRPQVCISSLEANVPAIRFEDPDTFRDEVWHMLLDWALDSSDSDAAFVCDANGLVICAVGKRDHAAEELASVAVSARVHLKRCSQKAIPPQLCSFQWPNWCLTMMTIGESRASTASLELMIGLVGNQQPQQDVLTAIEQTFKDKLNSP